MFNFEICFDHPWLLLLLIPAALFTLVPYFRIKKRYRRTRNRIISLVLHMLVMTLSILLLSGFAVRYYVPNEQNEIILLVDVSDTENEAKENRDIFIQNVLSESGDDGFNIGVVTFGFDQVYAVPLTTEIDTIYDAYLEAAVPDTTATNIEDALEYAAGLFNYPKTGKIVLITDAKETDGAVRDVISSIAAKGISIDAAYVPSNYADVDAQIINVALPEQYIGLEEEVDIVINLKSNVAGTAQISLYDNDELADQAQSFELVDGMQSIIVTHFFKDVGLHELHFQLAFDDSLEKNNEYTTYYDLQVYNKLLIIESKDGQSEALVSMLNGTEDKYQISVVNVAGDKMPASMDALRMYDQIILNNVANQDLPEGFDEMLQSYVSDYGGGLFTAGGKNAKGEAHAYNKKDMYGSIYQEMLPVQVFNYTPPIGVMIILDSSGSMLGNSDYGGTIFDSAKAAALACLDVLYERDYVGIMTLDTNQATILEMTPRTQETKIREALTALKPSGGNTVFGDSINAAGLKLRDMKGKVAKLHMIVISDGMTEAASTYEDKIKDFYEKDGTTFSVIGIGMEDSARTAMTNAVALGHGRLYDVPATGKITESLINSVKSDLNVPKVEDVNEEPFAPQVNNALSPLVRDLARDPVDRDRLTMNLGGFYGARLKEGADLVLMGNYTVPIYAQWKYGEGMVGSFMSDLQGTAWSAEFMGSQDGQTFLKRAIDNLMPTSNIRPNDITISLTEDNYTNTMSVFAKLKDGESVKGELIRETASGTEVISLNEVQENGGNTTFYTSSALTATNKYSHCKFIVKESGVYTIRLTKYDKDGNQVGDPLLVHKDFAYSEEYDQTSTPSKDDLALLLHDITTKGEGKVMVDLQDVEPVFEGFVIKIEKVFDPRWSFMITVIVLFLLDVAVCKFKFKWIHEIIFDRKRKKEL